MNFCIHCIKDIQIKSMMKNKTIGDCDLCNRKNVSIYDTEKDTYLIDQFEEFLDIYTCKEFLPNGFLPKNTSRLSDEIFNKWNIFNIEKERIDDVIISICKEKYRENKKIFEELVGISELYDKEYLENNSLLKNFEWEDFSNAIKKENRFHTNHINTNVLKKFLKFVEKTYPSGKIFLRARISTNENGFNKDDMGSPPPEKASAGRVNPLGISYLYLSDNLYTTFYEVRANVYDFVTVGEFALNRNINIIDLSQLDKISPFSGINCTEYAINLKHLKKISAEIARPLRKQDSQLDYLPTQYIAEFIKNNGYDGIEYKSTLGKEHTHNIVIFDKSICTCVDTKVYEINLNYNEKELSIG